MDGMGYDQFNIGLMTTKFGGEFHQAKEEKHQFGLTGS